MITERNTALSRTLQYAGSLVVLAVLGLGVPVGEAVVIKDNLYAVKAVSEREAWAAGNFGSIYHTTDGGKSWETRDSGTRLPLFGIDFADATHGWAVGKASLILATVDGGKSWKPQQSVIPPEKHLFNILALDARTVWVIGDWGAMAVTHDGGATWENRSLGTITVNVEESPDRVTTTLTDDVILYDLSFPDPEHGFVCGEFGTVLATSDGGRTWRKLPVGTEKTLFGVSFSTPERGWVVGIDGLVLRTRDGGKTWDVQRGRMGTGDLEELGFMETLKNPGLYDVVVKGQYGVVVGDTGTVLTTADGGDSWVGHELPEKQRLVWMRAADLVPGTQGFTVGAAGFVALIDHDKVVLPSGATAKVAEP